MASLARVGRTFRTYHSAQEVGTEGADAVYGRLLIGTSSSVILLVAVTVDAWVALLEATLPTLAVWLDVSDTPF